MYSAMSYDAVTQILRARLSDDEATVSELSFNAGEGRFLAVEDPGGAGKRLDVVAGDLHDGAVRQGDGAVLAQIATTGAFCAWA